MIDIKMIIYTPVDMPEIEVDDWETFWQTWNTHSRPLVKRDIGEKKSKDLYTRNISEDTVVWKGLDLYHNDYDNDPLLWDAPFVNISKKLPILYDCILEVASVFPMQCIRLAQSQLDITSHTDNNIDVWEIRGYLYHPSKKSQWYFTRPRDVLGERHYMELPETTQWFAYNDKRCWHGTDFDSEYKKILIQLFPKNIPEKTTELIAKSGMQKYKDYTIALN